MRKRARKNKEISYLKYYISKDYVALHFQANTQQVVHFKPYLGALLGSSAIILRAWIRR